MRVQNCHIVGAFLLPLTVGATNSSSVEGLLSSNNGKLLMIINRGVDADFFSSVDLGAWSAAYSKAQAFIAELSNEDKLNLITGNDIASANWTSLVFLDGTQGPQGYEYVTGWAETSALAHSWDKTMMWNQFKAVAAEFYNKGVQVTNAPTSQPLGRTPWGGRLVETMGQDSYLNGIMFGLGVKAFSETGMYV